MGGRRLVPAVPSSALLAWMAGTLALVAVTPAGGWAAFGVLLLLFLADGSWARRRGEPALEVGLASRLGQGQRASLELRLQPTGARAQRVRAVLDAPRGLATELADAEHALQLLPGKGASLTIELEARERGTHALGALHLRLLGPLGLAWWRAAVPLDRSVEVVPGMGQVGSTRLAAWRAQRIEGRRVSRQRDESGSFESLREYARGDDRRHIDWKASARRGRLIVRQFEAERSQSLVLCIDAGRLMAERIGGRQRLDAALAAAVVLADVARTWDDHVGIFVFSDRVEAALPPGRHAPDRIPSLLAGVTARSVEPDYPRAMARLSRMVRRRSLLVVFGDVIDREVSAPLAGQLRRLSRHHRTLFLALRNTELMAAASGPVADTVGAYQRAAACELTVARSTTLASMRRTGISVVDTDPDGTIAAAVNHYLAAKRSGSL